LSAAHSARARPLKVKNRSRPHDARTIAKLASAQSFIR
jgi:hypothetical protein